MSIRRTSVHVASVLLLALPACSGGGGPPGEEEPDGTPETPGTDGVTIGAGEGDDGEGEDAGGTGPDGAGATPADGTAEPEGAGDAAAEDAAGSEPDLPPDLPDGASDAAGDADAVEAGPSDAGAATDGDAGEGAEDAGGGTGEVEDAGAPEPPPLPLVVLNEIHCTAPEWVELISLDPPAVEPAVAPDGDGGALDLAGFAISDDPDDPDHVWVLPPGSAIEPGGFLVVSRDEDGAGEGYPFGLSCGKDTVFLLDPSGEVVDETPVSSLDEDGASEGRLPDGGGPWVPTDPTPGEPNVAWTPPPDPSDPLFDPFAEPMPILDLLLSAEAIASLKAAPYSWVTGTIALTDGSGAGEPKPVSVRLKGKLGSFRAIDQKAAFKVALDGGEDLGGLEELTLNNMVQDSSKVHEAMYYALSREAGVPSPRLGYAWVRLNGLVYGLYAHVETFDDVFLAKNFPSTLHLFEGQYGIDVTPENVDNLDLDEGEKKDVAGLQALTQAVKNAPDATWFEEVSAHADLEEMTRDWAVEVWTGHWDGYAPTINNYFLHEDGDGVFTMLPWGTDQTFSQKLDFFSGKGLMFKRCLAVPACRALYEYALLDVRVALEGVDLVAFGAAVAGRIAPAFKADPKKEQGYEVFARKVQEALVWVPARTAALDGLVACLAEGGGDVDGDGYTCLQDCDDGDGSAHPGGVEVCDDGVDQDCSGKPDDGAGCVDCTELFQGTHRYLACAKPRTWADARARCQEEGADLAVFETKGEMAWAAGASKPYVPPSAWIGLSDQGKEGTFQWVGGTPAAFTSWDPGQPDDAGANEDCVEMFPDAGWNDLPCAATRPFLCEDPCTAADDADGDGYPSCGADCDDGDPDTHPGAKDLCGDGIDQDCSGAADDVSGCVPCEIRWRGPHRYLMCSKALDWNASRKACQAAGSELVVLHSAAEAGWVLSTAKEVFGGAFWIGLHDQATEGKFVWADASLQDYAAWNGGEPNDYGTGEDCTEMFDNGKWNDLPCTVTHPFVCEDLCLPGEDEDGDGALRCADDCDDGDPGSFPGAEDVCEDGIDQDCNGSPDDGLACVPECFDLASGGADFAYCGVPTSWQAARERCLSLGLDLAWFDSLGQQFHVRALAAIASGKDPEPWIGLEDGALEGGFLWLFGQPPAWDGWHPNQPNGGGGANCVALTNGALWDDQPCSALRPALCRAPP